MRPYTIRLQGGQMIRALHLRRAVEACDPGNAHILDAGCGTGRDAIYFAAKYPDSRIVGVDADEKAINEAAGRLPVETRHAVSLGNVSFQKMDLLAMEYADRFDVIYSVEVLEHIAHHRKCIENFRRALRAGGKLLVHVPCPDQRRHFKRFEKRDYPDHVHSGFKARELVNLLESSGFRVLDVTYTSGWFGSLAWEIFEMLRERKFLKRAMFPIVLTLALLDTVVVNGRGNNVLVTAQRV
jgi:cyclopropane fatty-acyl-phospholipid synthase-like methyltransferase